MEITKKVHYDITAKAVYREGDLRMSVIVAAGYGDRTASIAIDEFDSKILSKLKEALEEAIEQVIEDAIAGADVAALRALDVATRYRESVTAEPEKKPAKGGKGDSE
jgi:hypothetical protein